MTTRTTRTSRRRSERRPRHVTSGRSAATRAKAPAEQRTRHSGGPEDHAFYICECGKAFSAAVTTSISCPRCGSGQAW